MSDKIKINIRFITATYDNKKEKKEHVRQMLNDGWEIESENKLYVHFTKSERIKC